MLCSNIEVGFDPLTEILIGDDGAVSQNSFSHINGFSPGFAHHDSQRTKSAINHLKSLLSGDSMTQRHTNVVRKSMSTILRSTSGSPASRSKFCESLVEEARFHQKAFRGRGTSLLVFSFILVFIRELETNPEFLQMAEQTKLTDDEKPARVGLKWLTESLLYLLGESDKISDSLDEPRQLVLRWCS